MTIYFKIWLPWLNLIKLNISYIDGKFRRVVVITVKTLGTKYHKILQKTRKDQHNFISFNGSKKTL